MSDESTNTGAPAGSGDGAEAKPSPSVRIAGQFVRDLSFENVAAIEGTQAQGTPEINVTVNLDAKEAVESRYQVAMKINATAKVADSTRFIVELDYVGVFEITNVPKEHLHPFLFIECPRQILPYARRVISDVTRDGGYPPLMIENIDFAVLYRRRLDELRAQQQNVPAN
jgi:preprotein translocase subunit SecB